MSQRPPSPLCYQLLCRRETADGQTDKSYLYSFATYLVKPYFRRIALLFNNIGDPDDMRFRRSEILCSTLIAEADLGQGRKPEMLDSGYSSVSCH